MQVAKSPFLPGKKPIVWTLPIILLVLATCQNTPQNTLFTGLNPNETGISFGNSLPEQSPAGMNIVQYLYYYNGGGVAAGDVNNDGLCDLFFTSNLGECQLFKNKGGFQFEKMPLPAALGTPEKTEKWTTGCTMADVNADGWLDIYVCQVGQYKKFAGHNLLYINNQNGTFSEKSAEFGLDIRAFSTQAAFFDYDRDGDLDCFLLCHSVHSPESYKDTSISRRNDPLASDRLLRNDGPPANGKGGFVDITAQSGLHDGKSGYGLGVTVSDLNGDGFLDIYVANDFHENDFIYLNQAGKRFRESIANCTGHTSNFSMGCDVADFNNDGLPDIATLDMKPEEEEILKASQPADQYQIAELKHQYGYHWQYPRNNLQLNQGNLAAGNAPLFAEIGQLAGISTTDWSWSALFADLDMDGQKDLFVTNGIPHRPNDSDFNRFSSSEAVQRNATDLDLVLKMPSGSAKNYAFRNQGDLHFENVAEKWGLDQAGFSNGAVYADLDNDGDLDVVTNNLNAPAGIFRNNSKGQHFLKIKLKGTAGNPFAVGAKVQIATPNGVQMFEIQPVRGFQSSVEPLVCAGLGTQTQATVVQVTWPDGRWQALRNVAADQTLTIQPDHPSNDRPALCATCGEEPNQYFSPDTKTFPNTEDNAFNDLLQEKLMPWMLSKQGPKLAVADVNKDGLEDYYSTGSGLFLQNAQGGFVQQPLAVGSKPATKFTAAAFFDADADGDPDLLVGSGGNEFKDPLSLRNFLLLNDGKGHFSAAAANALPEIHENIACLRPCDMDGDGDLDIFIGSRSVTGAYGISPRSFLLQNDGKGHFSDVTLQYAKDLAVIGMVTDAAWADVNNDKRPDLVVVGEWMPVTLLLNGGSAFQKVQVPQSAGLWNCLSAADMDADGDMDFIAGNFGLNAILQATPDEPIGLWVKDFDKNGSIDPILTYFRQGKNRVFADKDMLLAQLPMLKKRYVEYRDFAQSDFETIFTKALREGATNLKAEVLASCLLQNDGKGNFTLRPLPMAAQFAPVCAALPLQVDNDQKMDVLLGGNWHQVQPAIGRMDAGHGLLLCGLDGGQFSAVTGSASGFVVTGAIRDLALIKGKKRQVLVARNGAEGVVVVLKDH